MTTFGFFDWISSNNNGRFIIEGFLINLEIAVIAMVLAFLAGLALALLRLAKVRPVSVSAGLWIDTFRNLPLMLLILFMALTLPESWKTGWEENFTFLPSALESGLVLAAFLGLVLYNSAVLAEIIRAGILSLPRGQMEAAQALGMTYAVAMRKVILPQGLRRMMPAMVSQLITLNKDTTLVSIIAINEVMRRGRTVVATSNNPFTGGDVPAPIVEVFLFIGVLFIIVNLLLSRLSQRLELRERRRSGTSLKKVKGLEDQVALGPS